MDWKREFCSVMGKSMKKRNNRAKKQLWASYYYTNGIGCIISFAIMGTQGEWVKVAQLYPTLCNPMDSTVHGILQATILEWVAFPFSRGSSQPRDWTQVFHNAGRFFTSWATRESEGYKREEGEKPDQNTLTQRQPNTSSLIPKGSSMDFWPSPQTNAANNSSRKINPWHYS